MSNHNMFSCKIKRNKYLGSPVFWSRGIYTLFKSGAMKKYDFFFLISQWADTLNPH